MKLQVNTPTRSYSILLQENALGDSAVWAAHIAGKRVFIVTNSTVAPLYATTVVDACSHHAREVTTMTLPDGEAYKTATTLDQIYQTLLAAAADRKSLIVALGGGVVGDMAGFAAATYQRGIDFIQAPTTLLAMVDSSVGGKTGVNHPLGKNMIGAFHQPIAVVADPTTLKTLPAREYSAGMAEVIKHGLLADATYLSRIEANSAALQTRNPEAIAEIVKASCEIKADIVSRDEHETNGLRALLNLGHTFGHAIEAELGYGQWLHGEAVAAGIVLAARFSQQLGHINALDVQRIIALLSSFNLPTAPPPISPDAMLSHMSRDKKNADGRIKLILLKRLGEAYLDASVDRRQLTAFLQQEMTHQ